MGCAPAAAAVTATARAGTNRGSFMSRNFLPAGERSREAAAPCTSPPLGLRLTGDELGRNAMKIVDAQIHIWSQTVVPPSGLHRKVAKFTAEEALKEMDEAGVDAALIHPPYSWDPTSNQLALEAAKKYPDRFAVMGQFPLDDPESRKRIVGWRKQPGMMGLRWALLYPEQQRALH